jgi:hypothetical protein
MSFCDARRFNVTSSSDRPEPRAPRAGPTATGIRVRCRARKMQVARRTLIRVSLQNDPQNRRLYFVELRGFF